MKNESIKPSDVRIGNWVNFHIPMKVVSVSDKRNGDVIICEHNKELWDFKNEKKLVGEPISEDWILNFGFSKKDSNGVYWIKLKYSYKKSMNIGVVLRYSRSKSKTYASITNNNNPIGPDGTRVYFVHAFQNLFFALTEKELKINKQDGY